MAVAGSADDVRAPVAGIDGVAVDQAFTAEPVLGVERPHADAEALGEAARALGMVDVPVREQHHRDPHLALVCEAADRGPGGRGGQDRGRRPVHGGFPAR